MIRTTITLLLIVMISNVSAQEKEYPYPSLSPIGTISQTVGIH